MKKWIAVILLIIIAIVGYNYVYQDHRDIGTEIPEFSLTVKKIATEFSTDIKKSEERYLNKTIVITGDISESNVEYITLNSLVFCQLKEPLKIPLKKNSTITIKGRVIGYDDLLEQVKLDQCILIN